MSGTLLVLPKAFEPIGRESSIPHRILDIAVPQVGLERTGIVAVICQFVTAGVAEHMRMSLYA